MLKTWFSSLLPRAAATGCALSMLLACGGDPDPKPSSPGGESPPISVEVIRPLQLTADARLPEQDPNLSSVEVEADQLRLFYDKAPTPNFDVGNVVGGVLGGGYIRRVTQVTTDGTVVTVSTKPAELVEFIRDGAFRVRQVPAVDDWTTGDPMIGGHQSALSVRVPLLSSGALSCAVGHDQLLEVEPVFDLIDTDVDLAIDIRPDPAGIFGSLDSARFVFGGSLEAGIKATHVGSAVGTCALDITKLIGKKWGFEPKITLRPIRFMAGPVPVVITQYIKPTLKLEGKVSVSSDGTSVNYLGRHDLKVGTEYRDGEWHGVWEPKRSGTIDVSVPPDVDSISSQLSLWSGIEYSAYVYDTAGPKIGLESGFTGKASADLDTCRWNAELTGNIRASLSGSVQVPGIGREVAKVTGYWKLLTAPLGSDAGDLPEWLCTKETPPEPPKPSVPSSWKRTKRVTTTNSSYSSDGVTETSFSSNPGGWTRTTKSTLNKNQTQPWASTTTNDSQQVETFDLALKKCTRTTVFNEVITNYQNTGKTQNNSQPGTTLEWSCDASYLHQLPPGMLAGYQPRVPSCLSDGAGGYTMTGWDGKKYSGSTNNGFQTTTWEFQCSGCGGLPSDGCLCTASGAAQCN